MNIRPWPHRFVTRPGYEYLKDHFDGAAPKGLFSDVLSWEGFGLETRAIRPHMPHALLSRVNLEPKKSIYHTRSNALRFRFVHTAGRGSASVVRSPGACVSVVREDRWAFTEDHAAHRLYAVVNTPMTFSTSLGDLVVRPETYVFIPKGVTFSFFVHAADADPLLLLVESKELLWSPSVKACGQFFPFDFAALKLPTLQRTLRQHKQYTVSETDAFGSQFMRIIPEHPLACLAWSGFIYPFALPFTAIKTISSHTTHLSPDALATFVTADSSLKVATFLPRVLHSLPFAHRNVDYDEFLFYMSGYSARSVEKGDATFHPRGFHHGPEKNTYAKRPDLASGVVETLDKRWADEQAIMVESREPFLVSDEAMRTYFVP